MYFSYSTLNPERGTAINESYRDFINTQAYTKNNCRRALVNAYGFAQK